FFSLAPGLSLAGCSDARGAFSSEGWTDSSCFAGCLLAFCPVGSLIAAGRLAGDLAAGLDVAAAGTDLRVSLFAWLVFGAGVAGSCVAAAGFSTCGGAYATTVFL